MGAEPGEVTRWLRALVLVEGLRSILSTHVAIHIRP